VNTVHYLCAFLTVLSVHLSLCVCVCSDVQVIVLILCGIFVDILNLYTATLSDIVPSASYCWWQ